MYVDTCSRSHSTVPSSADKKKPIRQAFQRGVDSFWVICDGKLNFDEQIKYCVSFNFNWISPEYCIYIFDLIIEKLRCCERRYVNRRLKFFICSRERNMRARAQDTYVQKWFITLSDKIVRMRADVASSLLGGDAQPAVSNVKLCVISLIAAAQSAHATRRNEASPWGITWYLVPVG